MVKRFIKEGKDLFYSKQTNVLSAAIIIMVMFAASRFLGLGRNRVYVHYFSPDQLDGFLAAFQLPDMLFDLLNLGVMSAAFIPIFGRHLGKGERKEAWHVAAITLNVLLAFFSILSILIFIFADPMYAVFAKGFTPEKIHQTAYFTRWLLAAQMFFVVSYLLTAVLEAHQRFVVTATAPLFYNIGIILMTLLFAPSLGLWAPVLGVIFGSFLHLLIQLPLAISLGFRPIFNLNFKDKAVREVTKLAIPRIIELLFFQVKRLTDLFTASLILGGFTYFKFGDALASLPIGLFGLSVAKASFPQLSVHSGSDLSKFKSIFAASLKEILFLVIPASIFLAVLRLPLVRLAYGGQMFDWDDTLQTGFTVSAFSIGIFAYSLTLLVSRAFYALRDTITPVKVSIATIILNAILGFIFILTLHLPIWGLALAYSFAGIFQIIVLFYFLTKKVEGFDGYGIAEAVTKISIAAGTAGLVMYILLKILDRTAWDKKLSFLQYLGIGLPTTFDKFILDTRYTANLIYITSIVAFIGFVIYVGGCYLMKVEELRILFKVAQRLPIVKLLVIRRAHPDAKESITPTPNGN